MLLNLAKRPVLAALLLLATALGRGLPAQEPPAQIVLQPCKAAPADSKIFCGSLLVWEDRERKAGRRIRLYIIVLKAIGKKLRPDPIFVLAGGPGQAATPFAKSLAKSWLRNERDIVLVDQRGTGKSNPLHVRPENPSVKLQDHLRPLFEPELFRKAMTRLEKIADLRQYTTPIAMDDLDQVREALGYDKINLIGSSYGTRCALIYMRRHEAHVRCAILKGVAPPSFRNPLYHAWGAQQALDRIFADCAATAERRKAFPELRTKFEEVLQRLEKKSVKLELVRESTKKAEEIEITRANFLSGLRTLLYTMQTNRQIPRLIMLAHAGKFRAFATWAIRRNAGLGGSLALGMLMCVTGSEDIPRIKEEDIAQECGNSYWGEARVRSQMAVAAFWPKGKVAANYGKPVKVATPTLIFSGIYDPVTPPRWGSATAKHLENSLHVIVPQAHDYHGPCLEALQKAFLDKGSAKDLDTSCVKTMKAPKYEVDR